MALASRKYTEGSLHDLQLFLKKFHQFLNSEKGLDIPYEFVLSLPVIRKKGTVNKHIKEWNKKWFPKQNVVTQKSDNENIMPDFLN